MDVQLTPERTQKLRDLDDLVLQLGTQIEKLRRAKVPAERVKRIQDQLDTAEEQRRGLISEFGTGGRGQPKGR